MTSDEKKDLSSKASSFNENKTNSKPITIIDSSSLFEFIGELKDSSKLFIGKCNCKSNKAIIKKEINSSTNAKILCTDSWYNYKYLLKSFQDPKNRINLFNYNYNEDEFLAYQYILSILNLKSNSHVFLKFSDKMIPLQ